MRKTILIILLLIPVLWTFSYSDAVKPDFSEEEQKWLDKHPILYYAPDPEFAPYEYFENGELRGMVSDYLAELEEILNLKIEVVNTKTWTEVLNLAKNSEIDFLFLTKTIERSEYLHFTESFIDSPNVILVNEKIEKSVNPDNLGEFSVGVIKEYANAEYVKIIYPEAKVIEYSTISEALMELSFGNVDTFIVDLGQGSYYLKELNIGNLEMADEIDFDYNFSFGVPKDKEVFLSILEKAVKSIPQSKRKMIIEKWVEFQYKSWLNRTQIKWIIISSIVILIIVLGVVLWNRALQKTVVEKTLELKNLNNQLENKVVKRTEELKSANEKLQMSLDYLTEMQDELVESQKYAALGQLISGVAHEINTPLGNGITSISYVTEELNKLQLELSTNQLRKSRLNDSFNEMKEIVDVIFNSLKRVSSIISKFKELEISQITKIFEKINLKEELESIVDNYEFVQLNNVEVEIVINSEENLILETSPKWIEGIITNLIKNSLIHGFTNTEKGLITIKAKRIGDIVEIIYEDNGIGISEFDKEHVFEPFFSSKKSPKNIGLGLSVVYNTVVRHLSGKIELESKENEYTRVIIEIPL